jgi:hypothetical protein
MLFATILYLASPLAIAEQQGNKQLRGTLEEEVLVDEEDNNNDINADDIKMRDLHWVYTKKCLVWWNGKCHWYYYTKYWH